MALRLNAKRLDVAAIEPYFGPYLNVTVASAHLNASGELSASGSGAAMKTGYKGDAAMLDVRMLDKLSAEPFAGWGTLSFTKLLVNHDAKNTSVSAGVVTFARFYGSVVLDKQGKLNLRDVVAEPGAPKKSMTAEAEGAASSTEASAAPTRNNGSKLAQAAGPAASSVPAAAAGAGAGADGGEAAVVPGSAAQAVAATAASGPTAAPAAAAPSTAAPSTAAPPTAAPSGTAAAPAQAANVSKTGLDLRFSQLILRNGRAVYSDNFIQPNFTARLIDIDGTIGAFGTRSTTPAPVDVKANLAANGPVTIQGSINPLTRIPSLDLTAAAHDVELTNPDAVLDEIRGLPDHEGQAQRRPSLCARQRSSVGRQPSVHRPAHLRRARRQRHRDPSAGQARACAADELARRDRRQHSGLGFAVQSAVQRRRAGLEGDREPAREGGDGAVHAARERVRRQ